MCEVFCQQVCHTQHILLVERTWLWWGTLATQEGIDAKYPWWFLKVEIEKFEKL